MTVTALENAVGASTGAWSGSRTIADQLNPVTRPVDALLGLRARLVVRSTDPAGLDRDALLRLDAEWGASDE